MINFRYHVVSLTAVFLALALGVVMGSTVIDRAIVDGLRSRIDKVEHNAELRKDQNDQLHAEVDQLNDYITKTSGFAVTERLRSVLLTVFAVRGVDADAITKTVALAQQSGGRAPGIVWLEPKLALTKSDDVKALAGVLGLDTKNVKTLRAATWKAVAAPFGALETGGSGSDSTTTTAAAGSDTGTTTTTITAPPDELAAKELLTKLGERGFVSFEGVGDTGKGVALADLPRTDGLVLLASGAGAKIADNDVLLELSRAFSDAGVGTAAAEAFAESSKGPDRGTLVQPIVADDALAKKVSTIDNLETTRGQVVSVLALADLSRNVVGHYGIGGDASLSVPEWWRP